MRNIVVTLLLIIFSVWAAVSCRPLDEEVSATPQNLLRFSTDTISFDTVITALWSPSRRLRVQNPNSEAIIIEKVELQPNSAFEFEMVTDGRVGSTANDIFLRGGDSLLLILKLNLSATSVAQPFLIEESIKFKLKGRSEEQKIYVRAWGQNAIFFIGDSIVTNTTWADKERPYYIKDNLWVKEGITLTIKEGVTVRNFNQSNLLVFGSLKVEGSKAEPVKFLGTRLEREYDNQPNQWGAIAFLEKSKGNNVNYAEIRNGTQGLQVSTPDNRENQPELKVTNTIIRAMSGSGLFCFNAKVTGFNNTIIDCAGQLMGLWLGGDYNFWHNTLGFSGSPSFSRRNIPATIISSWWEIERDVFVVKPLKIFLANNLFTGNQVEDFTITPTRQGEALEVGLFNNFIRSQNSTFNINKNRLLNTNFPFRDVRRWNFRLDTLSPAQRVGLGLDSITNDPLIYLDQDGNTRPLILPDLGAYQRPN